MSVMKKLLLAFMFFWGCEASFLFISGDDSDDLGHCETAASCGGLMVTVFQTAILHSEITTSTKDVLAIGVMSDTSLAALLSWQGGAGFTFDIVTTTLQLSTVDFSDYKVLYLPGDESNTWGGIPCSLVEALNLRHLDIKTYVNDLGGSLISLTQDACPQKYGWLPRPLTTASISADVATITPLLHGLVPTLSPTSLNHCCYHTSFTGPAGYSGLNVLAHDSFGVPMIVGGSNLVLTSEICNDGIDNDGDGLVDLADPDCVETDCSDGEDNDFDGLIDCADSDCTGLIGCIIDDDDDADEVMPVCVHQQRRRTNNMQKKSFPFVYQRDQFWYGMGLSANDELHGMHVHAPVDYDAEVCISLTLWDDMGDGWNGAALHILSPELSYDATHTPNCTSGLEHGMVCIDKTLDMTAHWTFDISDAFAAPFSWEIKWSAQIVNESIVHFGDESTRMTFMFHNESKQWKLSSLISPAEIACPLCPPKPKPKPLAAKNNNNNNNNNLSIAPADHQPPKSWHLMQMQDTNLDGWFKAGFSGTVFSISDVAGKTRLHHGSLCGESADGACWIELSDGSYTLRVGGSGDEDRGDVLWQFCGTCGSAQTQISFNILHGQCHVVAEQTVADICLQFYAGAMYAVMNLQLTNATSKGESSPVFHAVCNSIISLTGVESCEVVHSTYSDVGNFFEITVLVSDTFDNAAEGMIYLLVAFDTILRADENGTSQLVSSLQQQPDNSPQTTHALETFAEIKMDGEIVFFLEDYTTSQRNPEMLHNGDFKNNHFSWKEYLHGSMPNTINGAMLCVSVLLVGIAVAVYVAGVKRHHVLLPDSSLHAPPPTRTLPHIPRKYKDYREIEVGVI